MLTVLGLNCIFLLCHYHAPFYHHLKLTFSWKWWLYLKLVSYKSIVPSQIADIFSLFLYCHVRTELDLGSSLLVHHWENELKTNLFLEMVTLLETGLLQEHCPLSNCWHFFSFSLLSCKNRVGSGIKLVGSPLGKWTEHGLNFLAQSLLYFWILVLPIFFF